MNEKKNYLFEAFDSKGKTKCSHIFCDITEEKADGIKKGIEVGLTVSYKEPRVTMREVTDKEIFQKMLF